MIRAKRAGLDGSEVRFSAAELDVGIELALKKLANENGRAGFDAKSDGVADQDLIEASGELGCEVANLIGVRKEHDRRTDFANELFQRGSESVGGVGGEQSVLDGIDAIELFVGEFARWHQQRPPILFARFAPRVAGRPRASPTTCDATRRRFAA